MKFPQFNEAHKRTLHIPSLTQGLSVSQNPHETADFYLEECINIWNDNGVIKTRPGIFTDTSKKILARQYSSADYKSYKIYDLQMDMDGHAKQLVLEIVDYDTSHQFCVTHFVSEDGTVYKTANIHFSRISDDTFYIPDTVKFFKGKPKTGCGLFAIIGLVNCEDYTQKIGKIYELTADFTSWNNAVYSYIPTMLINGRGNKYEFAKGTNQAFTGTPTRVEGLNVLNRSFYAYYSSDGYSSSFKLPISNLSSGEVVGRFYYSVSNYVTWHIAEGQISAAATLYGTTVTMNVDREKGIVYFTVPAGEYELPLVSNQNENNLRITADKDSGYSILDIAFGNTALNIDDKILVADKNIIFEANFANPLYFPLDSTVLAGTEDSSVNTIAHIGKNIFAFKENEIYKISVKSGKKLDGISVLTNSNAIFYSVDTLTANRISTQSGCKKNTSISLFGDSLYWVACDLKVHSLSASGKENILYTQPDMEFLLNINNFSSVQNLTFCNGCVFMNENRAVLLSIDPKGKSAWFYWEFPRNIRISGAYSLNGKPRLLCINTDGYICFTAELSGEIDCCLTNDDSVLSTSISSYLRTKKISLGCDNTFKRLDFVTVNLKGDTKVSINDRFVAEINNLNYDFASPFKITPALCGTNLIDISFSADGPLTLGSIDIGYTSLEL